MGNDGYLYLLVQQTASSSKKTEVSFISVAVGNILQSNWMSAIYGTKAFLSLGPVVIIRAVYLFAIEGCYW